ncbi:hypothetical protein KP509_19G048900 [Ceratopteris richardii]|uniref:Histone deacetylase complex subunit SAP30 Sin3 binding domain-containing protein n=1 Tax=Ceratopteris richardii TaxID=49495 RepID=A0A8T2SM67_CERRI|nr:hypothetical protein KP509_19G048900 [Ceratopteris richardii]
MIYPFNEDNQRPVKARIRAQKSKKKFSISAARCHIGDASPPSPKASHKILKVNLNKLETETLWRYWRRFILVDASPHLSKEQLVDAVERHFISQELDELQVIDQFIQAAKRLKTVYG